MRFSSWEESRAAANRLSEQVTGTPKILVFREKLACLRRQQALTEREIKETQHQIGELLKAEQEGCQHQFVFFSKREGEEEIALFKVCKCCGLKLSRPSYFVNGCDYCWSNRVTVTGQTSQPDVLADWKVDEAVYFVKCADCGKEFIVPKLDGLEVQSYKLTVRRE